LHRYARSYPKAIYMDVRVLPASVRGMKTAI
jgi:hypothetical protein